MSRAALLAVLVALALPMGVAGAPTDEPATAVSADPADVAVLSLDAPARSGYATESTDVASALAAERDAAAIRLERYALAERFQRTDVREDRQRLLFEAVSDTGARIDALYEEERQLRTAYLDGSIDAETFVGGLVRLSVRAGELRATVTRIHAFDGEIPRFTLNRRINRLEGTLFGFDGRVRERALAATRGDEPRARLHVDAAEGGVVLATIDGERYVREAYRADNRDPENTTVIGFGEAYSVTERLYAPYAFNYTLTQGNDLKRFGDTYRLIMELGSQELEGGSIEAHLDGSTRQVFFEVQERRLDLVASTVTAEGAANGTRLVVNRTFPGGPLRLAVSDNETGEPLDATVHVGDRTVRTGPDGEAWTLAPRDPVEVTAVGPSGNVTAAVRPLAPTPVHAGEG